MNGLPPSQNSPVLIDLPLLPILLSCLYFLPGYWPISVYLKHNWQNTIVPHHFSRLALLFCSCLDLSFRMSNLARTVSMCLTEQVPFKSQAGNASSLSLTMSLWRSLNNYVPSLGTGFWSVTPVESFVWFARQLCLLSMSLFIWT